MRESHPERDKVCRFFLHCTEGGSPRSALGTNSYNCGGFHTSMSPARLTGRPPNCLIDTSHRQEIALGTWFWQICMVRGDRRGSSTMTLLTYKVWLLARYKTTYSVDNTVKW